MFESALTNKTSAITKNNSGSERKVQRKSEITSPLSGIISSAATSRSVQFKLYISGKNDTYEKEADLAADNIVSSSTPAGPSSTSKTDSVTALQRKAESGEKVEEKLQKKAEPGLPEKEDEIIQGKDAGTENVPGVFMRNLENQKGGGFSIPDNIRTYMESGFSHDFGNVKLHSDAGSVQMNRQLKSQAFAHGSDIYFNEGKYNPGTKEGTHLLAHELTHVIQQGKAKTKKPAGQLNKPPASNSISAPINGQAAERNRLISNEPGTVNKGSTVDGVKVLSSVKAEESAPAAETLKGKTGQEKINTETGKNKKAEMKTGTLSGILSPKGKIGFAGPGVSGQKSVKPETLSMTGSSENILENFTRAGATQIAATFPSLGNAVENKLRSEQREAATSIPSLKAETGGVKTQKEKKALEPRGKSAEIGKGVTGSEPPKPVMKPHENTLPPPDNEKATNQLDKKDSGGFFSWFRNMFTDFMSSISTSDPGVNTYAGPAPKMNLSGEADPGRAGNQRNQSDLEVDKGNSETVNAIQSNPGKENIQPANVDEAKKPQISKDTQIKIESREQNGMQDYLDLKYPPDMRNAADKKMAPIVDKDLAKQRDEVAASAEKRDQDKNDAVTKAQSEADKLNKDASKNQNEIVGKSRNEVAGHQKAGLKEANDKLAEFNKEADTEQSGSLKQIKDRADKDQSDADKKMTDAGKEAEAEKKKGEEEARKKKEELKKESEHQSWWDRAVNAVKSAVKAITHAIDAVFNAVRKAVKFIIDKAKNAALALIEAGRKWIVDKLDKFGKWLKDKVNKYLSAFPALAKRINAAIDATVNKAKAAVNFVADKLKAGVEALANKLASAIDSVLSKFQTALKAAVQISGALLTGDFAEALKIAFFAACEIAGIDPNPIINFLNNAGDTIKIIFKDPVGFILNIARGVKKGLDQFFANIKKHLLNGLIQWLTGAISEIGITLPENFDLKGIFSLVMQILGLTYQNIRAKVVKKLGPNGEEIVSKIESGLEFVKELITKGPIALWDRVKDSLSSLKDTVLSGIRDWIITAVIKEGIIWLISLLNPASALAKALKMLYDVVMFLIERYKQIVDFVKSVFESVGALARGSLDKAANAVENALARSVPVVISFMASLLGLGGIGKTIRGIIEKIRKPVDSALEKVIGWIADKGKALFAAGKSLLKKGKEKLFGKEKDEKKENPLTAENNKKQAAKKVRAAMVHGIEKKELIGLLAGLEKEYNLKSATLNENDDAVIYNSEPVIEKGKEITDAPSPLALKQEKRNLKKIRAEVLNSEHIRLRILQCRR